MNILRRLQVVVFCALAAAWSGPLGFADSVSTGDSADVQANRVVRVGYNQFFPYSFTDPDGDAKGYSIDLIQHLARATGYQIEFVAAAHPGELMDMVASGKIDLTSLLAITPERQKIGVYTDQIGAYEISLFVEADSDITVPKDAAGRKVGAVEGAVNVAAAQTIPFVEVAELRDQNAMIVALLAGDVEAISAPVETLQSELRRMSLEYRARLVRPPLLELPRAFIVRPGLDVLLADFNTAIATELTPEVIEAVQSRWFGRDRGILETPYLRSAIIMATVLILGILVFVINTILSRRRAQKSFAENARNRLLVNALNGIDLSIIIFDRSFSAVHWNDAVVRNFARMEPVLRRGCTLSEVISLSYQNGVTKARLTADQAEAFAREIKSKMLAGEDTMRMIEMSDGRIYEATEFPIGEGYFATIRKDVSRIEHQASQIRAQKADLQAMNDQLASFTSVAAHDLRAPVHQQQALIQFIEEDLTDAGIAMPAEVAVNMVSLRQTAERMAVLIEELLAYARAGSGATDVCEFDSAQRVGNVLAMMAVPMGFSVSVAPDLPRLIGSPTGFDIVVRNLVSNAVNHHDRKTGHISVRGWRNGAVTTFEIEDDGPGIPEEMRARIFEPFQRGNEDSQIQGSGLGLSFVKRAVEAWGGTISVSAPADRGVMFRVTLPDANVGALAEGSGQPRKGLTEADGMIDRLSRIASR